MSTVGEALVQQLEARGVAVVFGIPGVHTIELYRGLEGSTLRHVTPRHEQSCGFMADGYARVSGQPGVAFVITGPGVTNVLSPMAQARADSVPMLVISGVNPVDSAGAGLGLLHELPDQGGLMALVARSSATIGSADELAQVIDQAFDTAAGPRAGPVHVQVPLDVMKQVVPESALAVEPSVPAGSAVSPSESERAGTGTGVVNGTGAGVAFRSGATADRLERALETLRQWQRPVIIAGGGARHANHRIRALAERLGAPVVLTTNARGLLHAHPLCVPASPSLVAVRSLLAEADGVLALGTEFGQTDYDMAVDGGMPALDALIRVDKCPAQLARLPAAHAICADVAVAVQAWVGLWTADAVDADKPRTMAARATQGEARAAAVRASAWQEIGPETRALVEQLQVIQSELPQAIFVGDSTQPVYAGNRYYDHDRPGGWFNAATGYGALGYAIPAAIGASVAAPEATVVCLVGDGGAQFSLPELMCAHDERVPVLYIVWNSLGYQEIEHWMLEAGVSVIGCDPTPPDFQLTAQACGLAYCACDMTVAGLREALRALEVGAGLDGPAMLEIRMS